MANIAYSSFRPLVSFSSQNAWRPCRIFTDFFPIPLSFIPNLLLFALRGGLLSCLVLDNIESIEWAGWSVLLFSWTGILGCEYMFDVWVALIALAMELCVGRYSLFPWRLLFVSLSIPFG